MTKTELLESISEKERKYSDLLWFARTRPENLSIEGVNEKLAEIEKSYPFEVSELGSDNSDWQHGFHSGMVAALRYILTLDDLGKEQADEEFPMLDS
jgi:hypothetical protein